MVSFDKQISIGYTLLLDLLYFVGKQSSFEVSFDKQIGLSIFSLHIETIAFGGLSVVIGITLVIYSLPTKSIGVIWCWMIKLFIRLLSDGDY